MPYSDKVPRINNPAFDLFAPARHSDPRGIELGVALDGGNSYRPWIGYSTVRELALKHADKTGLVDEELYTAAEAAIVRLENENERLYTRVAELETKDERIAGLAADDGYTVVRKQGRLSQKQKVGV